MKQALFVSAIASILTINSVMADTTSTVTSRGYVDAAVATKQNKIDATGANFTNGSVVETTGTDGVVTQRGIFNPETDAETDPFDGSVWPKQGHANDLVTAGPIYEQINDTAYIVKNHTHKIRQECAEYVANAEQKTPENCLLWYLPYTETGPAVYLGGSCATDADCGDRQYCKSGVCDILVN